MSNSDAIKARIAQLRRDRVSYKGKAKRADATALDLRIKAGEARTQVRRLGQLIQDLGGKVRS